MCQITSVDLILLRCQLVKDRYQEYMSIRKITHPQNNHTEVVV